MTTDPDELPIIFLTGYRINYVAGGKAVPLKPSLIKILGVGVTYKSNSAKFIKDDGLSSHVVPNFIDSTFSPGSKTFVQLTPDGPLPPP